MLTPLRWYRLALAPPIALATDSYPASKFMS